MKNMTAKFPGTCKVCDGPIRRGDAINFFGKGHAEHASCTNHSGKSEKLDEPKTAASLPAAYRTFKSRNGRCEDAPCCGCCGPQGDGDYYGTGIGGDYY